MGRKEQGEKEDCVGRGVLKEVKSWSKEKGVWIREKIGKRT